MGNTSRAGIWKNFFVCSLAGKLIAIQLENLIKSRISHGSAESPPRSQSNVPAQQ